MKRSFYLNLILFFLLINSLKSVAGSYYSAASGNWNSSASWVNGQIPPLNGTDSIYIQHHIMYNYTLNLVSATYLYIDSGASVCGHYKFFVRSGSEVANYGEIYADTMGIASGGLVNNYGFMQLANLGIIAGTLNSGNMQVGGNFLCSEKPGGEAELENVQFTNFYPLPGKNGEEIHCSFKNWAGDFRVQIFSMTGEMVLETEMGEEGGFYVNGLTPGIYLVRIEEQKRILGYGKLILVE
jgi:hypothetical protein